MAVNFESLEDSIQEVIIGSFTKNSIDEQIEKYKHLLQIMKNPLEIAKRKIEGIAIETIKSQSETVKEDLSKTLDAYFKIYSIGENIEEKYFTREELIKSCMNDLLIGNQHASMIKLLEKNIMVGAMDTLTPKAKQELGDYYIKQVAALKGWKYTSEEEAQEADTEVQNIIEAMNNSFSINPGQLAQLYPQELGQQPSNQPVQLNPQELGQQPSNQPVQLNPQELEHTESELGNIQTNLDIYGMEMEE